MEWTCEMVQFRTLMIIKNVHTCTLDRCFILIFSRQKIMFDVSDDDGALIT